MAQWVLNINGNLISRRSFRHLTSEEIQKGTERQKQNYIDELIRIRLSDSLTIIQPVVPTEPKLNFLMISKIMTILSMELRWILTLLT